LLDRDWVDWYLFDWHLFDWCWADWYWVDWYWVGGRGLRWHCDDGYLVDRSLDGEYFDDGRWRENGLRHRDLIRNAGIIA
jgi:hypothetical protein